VEKSLKAHLVRNGNKWDIRNKQDYLKRNSWQVLQETRRLWYKDTGKVYKYVTRKILLRKNKIQKNYDIGVEETEEPIVFTSMNLWACDSSILGKVWFRKGQPLASIIWGLMYCKFEKTKRQQPYLWFWDG